MKFEGQIALDVVITAAAIIFTLITVAYVAMLWSVRRNFFILLRSPLLTCMFGLFVVVRTNAKAYEFVVNWQGDEIGRYGTAALLGGASLLAADVAVVMMVVRLLVMYYPSKRARWGRYVKEEFLVRVLGCAWILMEIGVWSAAWALGVPRTASTMETVLRPLSFVTTLFAAAWLVWRLRNVHDSTNLSRDIGLVGRSLVVALCLLGALLAFPLPRTVDKYAQIVLESVSKIPAVYFIIIRPVREVLRHIPSHSITVSQKLLAPRRKKGEPASAPTDEGRERTFTTNQGRAVCIDGNRLATIMSFPTLAEAFGEFCRKSLCSESFGFLVDVAAFRAFDRSAEGDGEHELALDFATYHVIVHDYVRHDAHSEINIGSTTRQRILKYEKFEDYRSLSSDERQGIFNDAEASISSLLTDNLMSKFLASAEYTDVVDLESREPGT